MAHSQDEQQAIARRDDDCEGGARQEHGAGAQKRAEHDVYLVLELTDGERLALSYVMPAG